MVRADTSAVTRIDAHVADSAARGSSVGLDVGAGVAFGTADGGAATVWAWANVMTWARRRTDVDRNMMHVGLLGRDAMPVDARWPRR